VLVHNQFGVLNRVTSMFRRRQFNICSLAVSETESDAYSRITIQSEGDEIKKEQLINQLYKLPDDGIELLREDAPAGPKDVVVGGQAVFSSLSEGAQENIQTYYEQRGLLYDIPTELEKAYAAYQRCQESGKEFSSFQAKQEIYPCGANDTVCYYSTSVTTSYDVQLANELRLCEAFRRDTGEKIEAMDLFTVSQEEAARWFADYYGQYDKDGLLNEEMREAFQPEYVIFRSSGLEVMFPAGTLPSQESATGMYLAYEEAEDVLQEWAVPDPTESD